MYNISTGSQTLLRVTCDDIVSALYIDGMLLNGTENDANWNRVSTHVIPQGNVFNIKKYDAG